MPHNSLLTDYCAALLLFVYFGIILQIKTISTMLFKTLFLTAVMALSSIVAIAVPVVQADTLRLTERQELREVEVVSVRSRVASEHLRVVSVIGNEQIKAIPATNINELLENIPGLDVRTRGAGGVQADLSMRGSTFDQVVVLLNGVNITDADGALQPRPADRPCRYRPYRGASGHVDEHLRAVGFCRGNKYRYRFADRKRYDRCLVGRRIWFDKRLVGSQLRCRPVAVAFVGII